MSSIIIPPGVKFIDENGVSYGVKHVNNKPRVSSMPYLYDIGEGNIANHYLFKMIGYHPSIDTTKEDVWSYGGTQGVYVFPTAEQQMEFLSSNNTQDIGTVIKGDATGDTVQSDADGTTTTLEDDSVDFTAATAVAAGDIVILDPHGTTPEWGFVTGVAANTLTVAGGFSSGGTGASRYYAVIDVSAHTGALVGHFHYLDGDYVEHSEIIVLNGTTVTTTVNTDIFRINSFNIVATGSGGVPVGNISLRNLADTPVYAYITAGFNVSRQLIGTVPAGNTLYITQWMIGWATPNGSKVQTARFIGYANAEPEAGFLCGHTFFPYVEAIISNAQEQINFDIPIRVPEKTDMRVQGIASTAGSGPAVSVVRGWIES